MVSGNKILKNIYLVAHDCNVTYSPWFQRI